ncbi:MAG: hypothetical protein WCS54_00985 [Fibrobacteraceae bacterium]
MRLISILLFVTFIAGCSDTVPDSSNDDQASSSSVKMNSSSSAGIASSAFSSSASSSSVSLSSASQVPDSWDGSTAKAFAGGAGTKANPYLIETPTQLAHLSFVVAANDAEYVGAYYRLETDISLNPETLIDSQGAFIADSSGLNRWTPVGNSSVAFSGVFDGNGHTVRGLFINTTGAYNGLFGNSTGTVMNVTVKNSWIAGGNYTAGIVGYNTGMVSGCENAAAVTGRGEATGGVVGASTNRLLANYYPVIKNVKNAGSVAGGSQVGGVCGSAYRTELDSVYNSGAVQGTMYTGGIVGYSFLGSLSGTHWINTASVTGKTYTGGVIGVCGYTECYDFNSCGTFTHVGNSGEVSGTDYTGGIAGHLAEGSVTGAYNVGTVEGGNYAGGLMGRACFVTTSQMYNRGGVSGGKYVGGVFGYDKQGVASSAYTSSKVTGADTLVGLAIGYGYKTALSDYYYEPHNAMAPFGTNDGAGSVLAKTAAEMQTSDFAKLLGDGWTVVSGVNDGYPAPNWQ